MFGPFKVDQGHTRSCDPRQGSSRRKRSTFKQSEMCATCHTLYTHALGPQGEVIGSVPEQVPYSSGDTAHTARNGVARHATCRRCRGHRRMTSVLGKPRPGFSRHMFRRRQRLHAADAKPVSRRSRRRSASIGEIDATARARRCSCSRKPRRSRSKRASARQTADSSSMSPCATYRPRVPRPHIPPAEAGFTCPYATARGEQYSNPAPSQPNGAIPGNDNDADAARYSRTTVRFARPNKYRSTNR